MTTDAAPYYRETLLARLVRLYGLRHAHQGDLNDIGTRMLYLCYVAAIDDCRAAGVDLALMRPYLSSAPPPPAESSPEDRPR